MTLKDNMVTDLDNVILNTDELSYSIVYTARASGGFSGTVVGDVSPLQADFRESEEGRATHIIKRCEVTLSQTALGAYQPVREDKMVITQQHGEETYHVETAYDADGAWLLQCRQSTPVEWFGGPGQRLSEV